MKRFLLLAAVVGALTLGGFGFASTANAHPGWGHGGYGGYHGGWGPRYHGGYRTYAYGYRPYVAPGFYAGGPRFSIGFNSGIGCGNPYNYYGSAVYPPAYGW
jgi:hypothetical protein